MLPEQRIQQSDASALITRLTSELDNFEDIAKYLEPQPVDVPHLAGLDIAGGTHPFSGLVGGDHLIYVDFKRRFDLEARIAHGNAEGKADLVTNLKRCQRSAGIALLDVTGHHITDALMAAMLHQAFLLGAIYELDMSGRVTGRLFENLNAQFYRSSSEHKFVSLTYGEICEDETFRFLSAAQPFPSVFSNRYDRFMAVNQRLRLSFPPVGLLPSRDVTDGFQPRSFLGFKERYEMNEWRLMGEGDILLLHTDGVTEHCNAQGDYFPEQLEQALREVKQLPAVGIYDAVMANLLAFGEPNDDISLVVVKRL